jgi:5-methylcytosine-specific restriction endonuclease McrA
VVDRGETFGIRRKDDWCYLLLTPVLFEELHDTREQRHYPPNSKWTAILLGGKEHEVLRFPVKHIWRYDYYLREKLFTRAKGREQHKQRKAWLDEQPEYHTEEDLQLIWKIQRGRCYFTGKKLGLTFSTSLHSVDHIIPISNGGSDGPLNIALVLPRINSLKAHDSKESFIRHLELDESQKAEILRIDRERRRIFKLVKRKKQRKQA